MRTIKSIIASILLLSALGLSAQTQEINNQSKISNDFSASFTKYFIGGSLNFNFDEDSGPQGFLEPILSSLGPADISTSSTTSIFTLAVSPYLGIRKTEKNAIGISAFFNLRRNEYADGLVFTFGNLGPFTDSQIDFGLGVFLRHEFHPENRFTFFAQSSFGYSREHYRRKDEIDAPRLLEINDLIVISAAFGGKFSVDQNWNLIVSLANVEYTNGLKTYPQIDSLQSFNSAISLNASLSNIRFGVERSF